MEKSFFSAVTYKRVFIYNWSITRIIIMFYYRDLKLSLQLSHAPDQFHLNKYALDQI